MTLYLQRLLLITATVLSSTMIFSLCGCARMSGLVMNESGQAYYQKGNYSLARQEFEKAMIDDPSNAHYAFNMAAAAHKQGDVEVAEQVYRQALNLDPSYQPAYHGLATLMTQSGRTDEALQLLAGWAGSQPYAAESHIEMAWLQRESGDPMAAEQSLRQALQVNPQHEKALAQLGQVYEQQGRSGEAVAMYQKALYLDPTQPQVKSRMAALQRQQPGSMYSGSQSPAMMAQMPMSPGMLPASEMAVTYPQAYPATQNNYSSMSQYYNPAANIPTYGNQISPGTMQAPMISHWETPTLATPEMAGPTLAHEHLGMTQEISSQSSILVVPPATPGHDFPSSVPQISQSIPEIQAF